MIEDVATYEENPLLKEIREDYARNGQQLFDRTSETTGVVQDELRSSSTKGGKPRREPASATRRTTRSKGRTSRSGTTSKRSDSRKRRTDTTSNQVSGSVDSSDQPAYGEVQQSSEVTDDNEKEKPTGLNAIPNAKEQRIRQEQEEHRQPKEKNKENLFTWLHSDNRGKNRKESTRKPFTESEAQAKRQPLIAALLDVFLYADELIYATHKAHNHVTIWQSIDEEEAGILADTWLARARRNGQAAAHVDGLIERHAELKVALILAPRFYKTIKTYAEGGGISVR